MRPVVDLSADDIVRLLHRLGRRLLARGLRADVYVFGGSAIALAHDGRRTTRDVDALVRPTAEVLAEARALAADEGLPEDWLSVSGAGFLPDLDGDWADGGQDFSGLRVVVADARTLIAMKSVASRSRDVRDLVLLYREAGIRTPEEVVEIVRETYPNGTPGRTPSDEDLRIEAAEVLALVET